MEQQDPALKTVTRLSRLIAFGMHHLVALTLLAGACLICAVAVTVLEVFLPPLKAFGLAVVITVVGCFVAFVYAVKTSLDESEDLPLPESDESKK